MKEADLMQLLIQQFLDIPQLLRRGLLAWLTAVTAEYLFLSPEMRALNHLDGFTHISPLRLILVTAAIFVLLHLLGRKFDTAIAERWALVGVFAVYAILALFVSYTLPFAVGCLMVLGILIVYAQRGWNLQLPRRSQVGKRDTPYLILTAGLALAFFLMICVWTVYRIYTFSNATFDFGIFAQMFHNLKTHGLPLTTLERDELLSHFDVHVSPIYYLMLPFYWFFPYSETLQILQAAVMTSALIPLWKLGTHHGLTGLQKTFLCVILLLTPAFSGGAGYDLHENCFLTPLLLWLFYGLDRRSTPITAVSALLTLMVKEDAPVYVAVIGLYTLLRGLLHRRDRKTLLTGISLLGSAIIWFFLATAHLAQNGDGVMTYRYDNFMFDDSGSLLTVIQAVLMNPLKALYECVDAGKISYIFLTMGSLLGLPLLTRRYERYLLLIPYALVNLMSDYSYQHDIFFQYNFGSIACLVYLTAVNLADVKIPWKRVTALVLTALCCFWLFLGSVGQKVNVYITRYGTYQEQYEAMEAALDLIPEHATVSSSSYLTPHIYQREKLYDLRFTSLEHLLSSDYVAIYLASTYGLDRYDGADGLRDKLETFGYRILTEIPGLLVIYYRE